MSTRDQQSNDERTTATSGTNESVPSFLNENHDASWSANLEQERYADDRETLIEHALAAINQTEAEYHVNLVTHPNHGTPEEYLEAPIRDQYPDAETSVVDQCGCGGYVYRIQQ
ncbi:CGCGG family putative rSAM-modified RiPP protein [Halorubrum sp. N11]|uniref:CGCGG family putative rSAM-modified RiPP protein n=1 Tax=Halorubrum sp. N11 TaxID=3402276 RepID=UPI003EBB0BAE